MESLSKLGWLPILTVLLATIGTIFAGIRLARYLRETSAAVHNDATQTHRRLLRLTNQMREAIRGFTVSNPNTIFTTCRSLEPNFQKLKIAIETLNKHYQSEFSEAHAHLKSEVLPPLTGILEALDTSAKMSTSDSFNVSSIKLYRALNDFIAQEYKGG